MIVYVMTGDYLVVWLELRMHFKGQELLKIQRVRLALRNKESYILFQVDWSVLYAMKSHDYFFLQNISWA